MTHSIAEILRHALIHYGYWAVAAMLFIENVGVPVPGETTLLIASFLAYSGSELQLPWIILVATAVTTIGGSLGFVLGYYEGRPLLERSERVFRISRGTIVRGENLFARFGPVTIFFARFVFGLRIIAGPMAGVLRMPWRKFLLWNFLGATVWVTTISGVGYLFGRHWHLLERAIRRFDIAVVIVGGIALLFWWWRSRRLR